MRYMLLIYADQTRYMPTTQEETEAEMAAYFAFGEQFKDKILAGEGLMPFNAATTVRLREGKTLVTDGPFAETKEQLGGFYIVKCENLDEAIEIAAHIPSATIGSIEVRPVVEFE
jgi:hypothetical protein